MIYRIRTRNLFCFCGETIVAPSQIREILGSKNHAEILIKKQLLDFVSLNHSAGGETSNNNLTEDDIFCQIVQIGYGKGSKNPVSSCTTFYAPNKNYSEGDMADKDELSISNEKWKVGVIPEGAISRVLPREFEEIYVRLYSRHQEHSTLVRAIFLQVHIFASLLSFFLLFFVIVV
jgi:hypothetical protein